MKFIRLFNKKLINCPLLECARLISCQATSIKGICCISTSVLLSYTVHPSTTGSKYCEPPLLSECVSFSNQVMTSSDFGL